MMGQKEKDERGNGEQNKSLSVKLKQRVREAERVGSDRNEAGEMLLWTFQDRGEGCRRPSGGTGASQEKDVA